MAVVAQPVFLLPWQISLFARPPGGLLYLCHQKKLDFTECLIFVGVTRHRHPVSRFHPLFYPPPCFLQLD